MPVTQVLGAAAPAVPPPPIVPGAPAPVVTPHLGAAPLPPNMHWALVLLLGSVTCGLFSLYRAFRQAAWVRKLLPRSNAIVMYALYVVLLFFSIATGGRSIARRTGLQAETLVALLRIGAAVCFWLGAFDIRSSMLGYYNQVEPIGLRLSPILTFFFTNLYLQHHMSRIFRGKTTGVLTPQG